MSERLPVVLLAALVIGAAPAGTLPPLKETERLLEERVTVQRSREGLPAASTFDYARLAADPEGLRQLARARKELLAVRPSRLDPRARRAWAINTYNFLVVEAVVRHGFPSGAQAAAGVMDIRIDGGPFFKTPLATIEGRAYALDDFEAQFLFDRHVPAADRAPAPAGLDPRVHFAIVCGARGCPALLPRLYRPETLDAQLEEAVRGALSGSKHLRWSGAPPALEVSQIFEWYAADFGGPQGVLAFVLRHAPPSLAGAITDAGVDRVTAFIPWDWTLNQTPPGAR